MHSHAPALKQDSLSPQFDRDLYCLACSGYVVIPGAFDEHTVDVLYAAAEPFEQEVQCFVEQGGRAILRHSWPLRTTRALYAIDLVFQDLIMHETIQAMARAYLGGFVVRDCLMQTNMPDARNACRGIDAAVSFHRDTKWPDGPIRPMYLHAFVLLQDFTRDNGATLVVPGTHRQREPGYYFKDSDPRSPQPGIDYRVYEQRYFPSAAHIEAPRGSLVFLDPMTIHTQGINVTSGRRSLINVTMRAATIPGTPPLLNARRLAERYARVRIRPDLIGQLESSPELPAHFGPLGPV